MIKKSVFTMILALFTLSAEVQAQNEPEPPPADQKPTDDKKPEDVEQPNRFWQAGVGGGHYMVALDRISAISRHKYLLDGGIMVDEVTVDALGQALVRFYFIAPLTDVLKSETGEVISKIVERGREAVERAADIVGTDAHNMVIKKFPETTHAREIEFRVETAEELGAIYDSVRTAWESGRGRKFGMKAPK